MSKNTRVSSRTLLVLTCALLVLFIFTPVSANVHGRSHYLLAVPNKLATAPSEQSPSKVPRVHSPPDIPLSGASAADPPYDEQVGLTFTQNSKSILYNITAVEQTDPLSGTGPAYLLNGLSNQGYWYQVGLSWNWNPGYSPGSGFDMNYEVFDPAGNTTFPTNGGGGLIGYSNAVNPGDIVALKLYFSNGNVTMFSQDLNTSAEASASYSAEGATSFVGLPSSSNSNGFFTGLMTEWYHPNPYYGNEQKVTYSSNLPISSATIWIDEYSPPCCSNSLFSASSGLVSYSNPTVLQEFSSNGVTAYSDAYEFITGALTGQVRLTMSYSVVGGGGGYSPPILTYVANGINTTATLSTSPLTFNADSGSSWSVTPTLGGSTSVERWQTSQATLGKADSSETVAFNYYKQYLQTLSYSASDSSNSIAPIFTADQFGSPAGQVLFAYPTGYWFDSGSPWSVTNPIAGGAGERWLINTANQANNGTISFSQTISFLYCHQFLDTLSYTVIGGGSPVTPIFTSSQLESSFRQALTPSPTEYWLDAGAAWNVTNPLNSSDVLQRWQTEQAFSGTLSSLTRATFVFRYYHQLPITVSYSIIDGGSPNAPAIGVIVFGNVSTDTLSRYPTSLWVDAGSTANFPASLVPSSDSERWVTSANLSLVVDSVLTESVLYQHQYFVSVESAMTGGGSVSPASQWCDATSTINLVASPVSGWRLGAWDGSGTESYSGNAKATELEVHGPINETAVFYPGLSLDIEPGGSATYSYDSTVGHISSGREILYVPPGTNVTLFADRSSILYSNGGWAIAAHETRMPKIAIVVNAPMTAEATFSYNWTAIGGLSGAGVVIGAILVLFTLEFRRRLKPHSVA